jgi:hypothetical protein
MSIHWRRGKLGVAGLSAAAIAVAAVPDQTPSPKAASRTIDNVRLRALAVAPTPAAVRLDMERLRRLQPARTEVEAAAKMLAGTAPAEAEPPPEAPAVEEAPARTEIVDAFASKTWYVPPPPPPPVKLEPPPKPTAPPLPFTFMGRYEDHEGPPVIMLVRGDRLYTVSEGDSIDGTYRVERVENGQIELTYLPLQEKQLLQTGNPG